LQPALAAFNLVQICGSSKVVFHTALFRAFKQAAQLFKNVCKHGVLQYRGVWFTADRRGRRRGSIDGKALVSCCLSLMKAAKPVE
jgi:hypothetical protein